MIQLITIFLLLLTVFQSHGSVVNTGCKQDLQGAFAGGLAGAAGTIILYPWDTAKTLRQSRSTEFQSVQSALLSFFDRGFLSGAKRAYHGVMAATLGAIPSSALYFGAYEFAKHRLLKIAYHLEGLPNQMCNDDGSLNSLFSENLKFETRIWVHALAAASGNSLSSLIFVPKEYLKQQMQSCEAVYNPTTNMITASTDCTLGSIFERTMRAEGFKGFYRGYTATLARNIPSAVLRFSLYEELKIRLGKVEDNENIVAFLAGAAAGSMASGLLTPLDVIKTNIATGNSPSKSVLPTLKWLINERGVQGIYAGAGSRMVCSTIFSAVGFAVFEGVKRTLNTQDCRIQQQKQKQLLIDSSQQMKDTLVK